MIHSVPDARAPWSSLSLDAWDAFERDHPAPTFFARPAWARALHADEEHLVPAPITAVTRSGSRVIVPLIRHRNRKLSPWQSFWGMPLGTYTAVMREDGSLADPSEISDALGALLASHCDLLELTLWPMQPHVAPPSMRESVHETSLIDVRGGVDAALARVNGKARRMAGQSARRGVICAPERGSDAVTTYYAMLSASAARWGRAAPTFSQRLLAAVVEYGGDDVEIWIARHDGTPIAGGVVLYGARELFFWSAAMHMEYAELRPSNALNYALIEAAARRGVDWYNLGSSEGAPGVARFKASLGADERSYCNLTHISAPYAAYRWVTSWTTRWTASARA